MGLLDTIKNLCATKDISVGNLEKLLKLSNGSIYKWDKVMPGADKIEKVANYFDVSTDFLLGRTAFKNGFELFEHWGYSTTGFEAAFDFGELLKEARESQGVSLEEVSQALGITVSDVSGIEDGILPINYEWAEKYAEFLGTSVSQIFFDNDMYDEQVPEQFHDNVKGYEVLKREDEMESTKEISLSNLTNHEEKVIMAYRKHFDMQPAVDKILGIDEPTRLNLLPNAAHEIEGAAEEDKAHDEQFWNDFKD